MGNERKTPGVLKKHIKQGEEGALFILGPELDNGESNAIEKEKNGRGATE